MKLRDALSSVTSRAEAADLLGIAPRTLAAQLMELGLGIGCDRRSLSPIASRMGGGDRLRGGVLGCCSPMQPNAT